VHHDCTTETKKTELDSTQLQESRMGLVNDVEVVNLVFAGSQLLQNRDIFACAPNCVDWYFELEVAAQEQRKLRKRQTLTLESFLDRRLWWRTCNVVLERIVEQWRVLCDMFEGPIAMSVRGNVRPLGVIQTHFSAILSKELSS